MPAGDFDALRIDSSFRIFGDVLGTPIDETEPGFDWYAPGVGRVLRDESGLVSFFVPEPSTALLVAGGLLGLAVRRRSQRA